MKIRFQRLTGTYEAQTAGLIRAGLTQHWGRYDATCNPDLSKLMQSYPESMLIGLHDDEVICCGGWKVTENQQAEIVRVSVKSCCQRQGVGSALLTALEKTLARKGITRIVLETTTTWTDVIQFYLRNGYSISHEDQSDTYFMKLLSGDSSRGS